jgi:hypothetical protein
MTQGGLNQRNRTATIKGVARMTMAQPMRGRFGVDTGSFRSSFHNAQYLIGADRPSFSAEEDWSFLRSRAPECHDSVIHARRDQDHAGFAALAQNADLPGVAACLQILPLEAAKFRSPNTGSVEQIQNCCISRVWFQREHALNVCFIEDSAAQLVPKRRQP